MMKWLSKTHPGNVRKRQEDSLGWWPKTNPVFFIIADGLGGHAHGDVASKTSVKKLLDLAQENKIFSHLSKLKSAFLECNQKLWDINQGKPADEYMATTLTAIYIHEESYIRLAHIGDTRIYRLRNDNWTQLTKDHSESAHTLTQAIGFEEKLDVQTRRIKICIKDLYLICSDGLYGMLSNHKIEKILKMEQSLERRADELLKAALDAGGHDNISFILVEI